MVFDQYSFPCPACRSKRLNLLAYSSLMVLRSDLGLFTVECPDCHNKVSLLRPIPPEVAKEVRHVACEIGAGMGTREEQ